MKEGPDIAQIAALIGDPARANMLTALMSGKSLTVSELAAECGVTIQTASAHLTKLTESDLVRASKQGRHKYISLASDDVARVLEGLMGLAAGAGQLRIRTGPKDAALRKARVCYNHLAGDLGTQLFDSLHANGHLVTENDDMRLSGSGIAFVNRFGIDTDALRAGKTPLCRACLDWSERRSHLAGSLGRAFLSRFEELSWAKRERDTRVIRFTGEGERFFKKLIAIG